MNDKAKWINKLLGVQQLSQMRLKWLKRRSASPHTNGEQTYGMASGLFNCYESAADVRSNADTWLSRQKLSCNPKKMPVHAVLDTSSGNCGSSECRRTS